MNSRRLAACLIPGLILLSPATVRAEVSVIPRPLVVDEKAGTFTLKAGAKVRIEGNFPGKELILPRLCAAAGIKLEAANEGEHATIVFKRAKQPGWKTDEDYQLDVTNGGIVVTGA
ncbi:MAG: glycoside hydrolase family 20 zincin-like fold domain-containing protein, partial [Luteolibacter sp.]